MLAAEEARAALLSIGDEGWHETALRRVRRLKRSLRRLAEPIITPPPQVYGAESYEQRQQDLWTAAIGLDELGTKQLAQVTDALHPALGATLARWWVAARAEPYGHGWGRRAFRAPTRPAMTRRKRIDELVAIVFGAGPYDRPPEWFAAWAPHLVVADPVSIHPFRLGPLLATAIDGGGPAGEATFRTLVDSANGDHAVGGMGRHVIVGMLRSAREDGWALIESMLLAAQRQEGLRQSILEAADEAHPDAFTRIIDLAVRENLIRFAATIRAVSVWFGFPEDAAHIDDAERRLRMLLAFRSDREMAARRVLEGDAWDTYAGLCAIAQFDVLPALELASAAMGLPDAHNRAAGLRFVANTQLSHAFTMPTYAAMTADPDLAVASLAHRAMGWAVEPKHTDVDVYSALDALVRRLPTKTTTVDPVGIDPGRVTLDRGAVVATMVSAVGNRPLEPLLEFLPSMDADTRGALVRRAAERKVLDGDLRAAVVKMVGDRSSRVRQEAVDAMGKLAPDPSEAPALEALLTRKAGDLRRGVIGLLSRLPAEEAAASAQRLWGGDGPQRDAACELLGEVERTDAVVAVGRRFLDDEPSTTQRDLLHALVAGDESSADDPTLGLYDPGDVTPPLTPRPAAKGRRFVDAAAFRIAETLDDLAERHRDTPFELANWQGSTEVLLADAVWLPNPFAPTPPNSDAGGWGMVLPEVFRTWWDERPEDCRGESDPLDALRALVAALLCADHEDTPYRREAQAQVRTLLRPLVGDSRLQLRHPRVVLHVLHWLIAESADESVIAECIEAIEAAFAAVPPRRVAELAHLDDDWRSYQHDWRTGFDEQCPWLWLTGRLFARDSFLMATEHLAEWYGLMRWFDQPVSGAPRRPVASALVHAAHAIGAATDADVYEGFMATNRPGTVGGKAELLRFTKRRRSAVEERHPTVVPLVDRLRDRVIEIERSRGELSTAASPLAFGLASIEGADVTLELLARLGRSTLVRGYSWNNDGREAVYSRLIQISHPAPTDTPEVVAALVTQHRLTDRRLVDLAMFAPQWAPTLEKVLGWDGLEDAIWWFHVHTKDDRWSVEAEVRETWAAMSAERTSLAAADLTDGAVDVAWFGRARDRLGVERWSTLHKAAKLASGGSGHRRAQIFADAMVGQLDEADLITRLRTKRHQDTARAIGLLPLPEQGADEAALARYQVLREFERGSKKFGQQRQRSEATAVRIGVENLARTTGAPDPQRFVWAMEAAEAGALSDGPISVTEDDLTVVLSVDGEGMPEISVQRGEKRLKSVPAKMRKHPPIKALTDRRTALKRQASRVRRSLEDAMVRQDPFTDDDLAALDRHPVVAPMLDLVIWADEENATFRRRAGEWVDCEGRPGRPGGALRLAHPVDLLGTGNWIDWQEGFFDEAVRQPFKQAFRELYVPTETEAADSPFSRRWSGHQLQPGQASGLFTTRGWLSDRDEGTVAKVFHHAGLVARVEFVDGWGTPAEVELPTVDRVYFTERGDHLAQPLGAIPPIVFSETMRDLDLVVSVAHAGGVDPEASASTVEMRAALVRETARLMELDNVRQESSHLVIEGSLGEYSLHLGSGTVHRRPGGALCIIPVDAQRRGRIFLPFADDDPKTAEIVSKVLMLARDSTIKDPTILEQLRS